MSDDPTAGEAAVTPPPAETKPAAAPAAADTEAAGEIVTGESAPPDTEAAEAAAGEEEQPADPWSDPRLPWEGKPRRVDIVCWAAITLSGLYYLILLPFRASLVGTHPIVLIVLNGSTEAIVSGAAFARVGHGSVAVVLLAAIPGLMKFDLIFWWAGRLWGERIVGLFTGRRERQRRRADRFVAWVNRRGRWITWPAVVVAPFLPLPSAIFYAAAGWTGMSWITFLILDAIGSLGWAGMLAGLGWALGQHAVSVAQAISRYGLWISIAIVVLIIAGQVRGARTPK